MMCKQPDDSSIGQCEHNITQGFLLASLLWYQKVVFNKSPILSLSLYLALFFISIHQQYMLFWIGIGHTLINLMERENQIGPWSRSCLWLYYTKDWVTNQESPELPLYTFKPVWRTTFKSPWGKLPNFIGMKLTTDVILLFLPSVNDDVFV